MPPPPEMRGPTLFLLNSCFLPVCFSGVVGDSETCSACATDEVVRAETQVTNTHKMNIVCTNFPRARDSRSLQEEKEESVGTCASVERWSWGIERGLETAPENGGHLV